MTTELLSAKEKAKELGVSRSALTRLVQSGAVTPAYRAPGRTGVTLFTPEIDATQKVAADG